MHHKYLNGFYLVLTACMLLVAFGNCHAGQLSVNTPLISLDRAFPFAQYEVRTQFDGFEKSEAHWHGSIGVGFAYVISERVQITPKYLVGVKGDPNYGSLSVVYLFRK